MNAVSVRSVQQTLVRFLRAEDGATAIEYAMVAVGIAVAVVATVNATGSSLNTNFYGKVDDGLKN